MTLIARRRDDPISTGITARPARFLFIKGRHQVQMVFDRFRASSVWNQFLLYAHSVERGQLDILAYMLRTTRIEPLIFRYFFRDTFKLPT